MPARNHEEEPFRQSKVNAAPPERPASAPQRDYTKCPRGFGNIRTLGEDNSVSEKCLGCYRIMECYSEREWVKCILDSGIMIVKYGIFKSKLVVNNYFSYQ
jgi:hypothetical protein